MQTALRSEHPVLNSVYPQLNIADNKTNFCIDEVSSDDDEFEDEDDDVNDNGNHIDILFAKRCGLRRIGSCMQARDKTWKKGKRFHGES